MSFVLVDFRLDGFSDLSSLRTHFRAAYCMYCMRLLYVDMRSHCLLRNWRFQVPKNLRNDLSQRRPAIIVCRWSGICGSTLRIGRREGSSFAIWRGPFVENGAHSFAIEPQTESIFPCKLRNLCLPILLVQWPKAFQVPLVNQAVLPLAMHPVFDLLRQRFHCYLLPP